MPGPSWRDVLEHHSGLQGAVRHVGDMREVLAGRAAGDAACALAFDVYLHRLARETAAMTAALGGLDLLVLTGGVGEHAWQVRAALWPTALAASRESSVDAELEPGGDGRRRHQRRGGGGAHRRRHGAGGPGDPPSGARGPGRLTGGPGRSRETAAPSDDRGCGGAVARSARGRLVLALFLQPVGLFLGLVHRAVGVLRRAVDRVEDQGERPGVDEVVLVAGRDDDQVAWATFFSAPETVAFPVPLTKVRIWSVSGCVSSPISPPGGMVMMTSWVCSPVHSTRRKSGLVSASVAIVKLMTDAMTALLSSVRGLDDLPAP